MDKLKMHSPNLAEENIVKIRDLFPGCVTETEDTTGQLRLVVDFEQLRQELSSDIIDNEGDRERYRLDWPGKKQALTLANAPTAKTLRPLREESVHFDTTKNLFIEGDNLDALKLLQETYLGTVKMIYIDPPYNTKNNFIYKDDFSENKKDFLERSLQEDSNGNRLVSNPESNGRFHSDWLTMMYSRLRVARKLLSDDGAIFVHIDENEYPNLEKLLSEVFGENNNIGTIVWDKRNPKGDATTISYQHELISIYARDRETFREKVDFTRPKPNAGKMMDKAESLVNKHDSVTEECRKEYKEWLARMHKFSGGEKAYSLIDDDGHVYSSVSMGWPGNKKASDDYFIPLVHPVTKKHCKIPAKGWSNPPATMERLHAEGRIIFGRDESTIPRRKYLLSENTRESVPSLLQYAKSDDALFKEMKLSFDNPKPLEVAKYLIQTVCKHNDIVLDFFAGSSTSAHAVMDLNANFGMNLKFIMIQIPELISDENSSMFAKFRNIANLSKERIRCAGRKILANECNSGWNKDVGFRVLKIDTSNMADVWYYPKDFDQAYLPSLADNIKSDRMPEDLLFQVLVDCGIGLTLPIRQETVHSKKVFFVDDNALVACFDTGITEKLVRELAGRQPSLRRIIFCDRGFVSDAEKIDFRQIICQLSPNTDIRSI